MVRSRAPIWLVIAAFAAGHTAALVHGLGTRHVRCAEHGELIDVPWATSADADARVTASADGGSRDADHCLFGDHARVASPASHVRIDVVDLVRVDLAERAGPSRVVATSVLRFAPKTSPPV
jgi:hypothetical protein